LKKLKTHILFISILSASELSEARIALPFAIADGLCLPHAAAPQLPGKVEKAKGVP